MEKAASEVVKTAAESTQDQVNTGLVNAINTMGPQVQSALVDKAKAIIQVNKMKWFVGAVLVVALVFILSGCLANISGYSSGFETGKAAGYKAAADEKSAVAWANTDQGRMAYELAQAGSLKKLANCNSEGWKLEKSICTPYSYTQGKDKYVATWKVGKSAGGTPPRKINVSWLDYLFGKAA